MQNNSSIDMIPSASDLRLSAAQALIEAGVAKDIYWPIIQASNAGKTETTITLPPQYLDLAYAVLVERGYSVKIKSSSSGLMEVNWYEDHNTRQIVDAVWDAASDLADRLR